MVWPPCRWEATFGQSPRFYFRVWYIIRRRMSCSTQSTKQYFGKTYLRCPKSKKTMKKGHSWKLSFSAFRTWKAQGTLNNYESYQRLYPHNSSSKWDIGRLSPIWNKKMPAWTSKTAENDHFLMHFSLLLLERRDGGFLKEKKCHFPINFLRSF